MEGLSWVKTATGKNWLKRDLGEGQTAPEWHTCNGEKNVNIPKRQWYKFICAECGNTAMQNPRFFRRHKPGDICEDCDKKKFNNLDNYDIIL